MRAIAQQQTHRSQLRWAVAIPAALAAMLVVTAPPAIAKDATQKRIGGRIFGVYLTTQAADTPTTLEPQCPGKTKAIGGGFTAGVVTQSGVVTDASIPFESRLAGPQAWRTSAVQLHDPAANPLPLPPGARNFSAWVYCRKFKGGLQEVSRSGPLVTSAEAKSTARASCPRGRVAIAGGFSASPAPGPTFQYPSIYESFRSGQRAWTASANPSHQPSVAITSYVYCARHARAPLTRVGTKSVPGPTGTRSCPKRLQVGDGGFKLAPNSNAVIEASFAGLAGPPPTHEPGVLYATSGTWNVTGGSLVGVSPPPVAFGYCS
jgi:hypothetical protein